METFRKCNGSASAITDYFFGYSIKDEESDADDFEDYCCEDHCLSDADEDTCCSDGKEEELTISESSTNKIFLDVISSKKTSFHDTTHACSICLDDDLSDLVSVNECEHKFCRGCLSDYIGFKTADIHCLYHQVTLLSIKNSVMKVEDLKTYGVPCPAQGCRHVMMVNELKPLATPAAIEQFDRFSKIHKDNLEILEEQRRNAPAEPKPQCARCLCDKLKPGKRRRLICTKCGYPCCARCFNRHPVDMACSSFKQNGLANIWKVPGIHRCPKCSIPIQKNEGCNFMTCRCGQYWCNLCGCALDQDKHSSHFHNNPFGDKCRGKSDKSRLMK
eukprot:TRINITY_DN1922_c0_g1_i1.p1 TRINITY_DN1922_c0_g1~~TRINITY_DN1922_c0_g1_i1.p1  ORF type:complete len:331 (-),score=60.87 TRINITY_DN1922_c0_g1_i1:518-1510(-)